MTFQKKKKGGGYVVTWDSDASLEDDDSSDDDKKSKNKALASIATNNKSSIFDTSSTCLMVKSTKVQNDESDSDSDEKVDLMDMLEQAHSCLELKRKECKELRKELKALKQFFDELNAVTCDIGSTCDLISESHTN